MTFLALNGITVKCSLDGGAQRSVVYVGGASRGFDGTLRGGHRALKREWRFKTVPLDMVESAALQGLVEGRGEHWAFETHHDSDAGLTPAAGSIFSGIQGPGSLTGHGLYATQNGYTRSGEWDVGKPSEWTLLCSAFRPSSAWRRFMRRSDGAQWVQGARDDAGDLRILTYDTSSGLLRFRNAAFGGSAWAASQARAVGSCVVASVGTYSTFECTVAGTTGVAQPSWPDVYGATVSDGTVTWQNVGYAEAYVGDMAWLPFLVPESWASQVYAFHLARPWSPLPSLYASGRFAPSELLVQGEVTDVEQLRWQSAGTWVAGERVSFALREV
jgi:hypothetical protein